MRVLLTGAFGNLGVPTLRALLQHGHQVRCFDVPSRRTQKLARGFGNQIEIVWGDIRDAHRVHAAVAGQDAIVHNAALLPPVAERSPELAAAINVGGTNSLIGAAEAAPSPPLLIFTSSVAVFGRTQHLEPPRRASDPVVATDHYTRHKLECEAMLRGSRLRWLILRVGVALEAGTRSGDSEALRMMFEMAIDNRMEYVHPADVARAQAHAIECPQAWGKVLLIGGGPSCQIRQRDLFETFFAAMGLGQVPAAAFGQQSFYADWMDTEESQRLLRYQRYSFSDYRRDMHWRMRHVRRVLWPVRPLVRRHLLGYSSSWAARGAVRGTASTPVA
jgi:nucleoside-diphosphate-sugar epimerase